MVRIEEIRKDFEKVSRANILAILLCGSYAGNYATPRSDVDICIVIGKEDKEIAKKIFSEILRKVPVALKNYDILIFELLPLKFKAEIIENHRIIWARDKVELSWYFYKFRKLWKDVKIRIEKIERAKGLSSI